MLSTEVGGGVARKIIDLEGGHMNRMAVRIRKTVISFTFISVPSPCMGCLPAILQII